MIVDAEPGRDGKDDVDVEEGFIEGVADGREGLDEDDEHSDGASEAGVGERVDFELVEEAWPACCGDFDVGPAEGVDEAFDDDDASYPTVD